MCLYKDRVTQGLLCPVSIGVGNPPVLGSL